MKMQQRNTTHNKIGLVKDSKQIKLTLSVLLRFLEWYLNHQFI